MLYDLHTHSDCSDGQLSPSALVELAIDKGVDVLALTDHDTLDGVTEAQEAAEGRLQLIPGIELSTLWYSLNIHIVGLRVDLISSSLQEAVASQSDIRRQRSEDIAQRLEKVGVSGALEGAKYYAKGDNIGRPHFARYLVDAEYVSSYAQAFKKYLGVGKVGDVKHYWPDIETAVFWIKAAGGIPVLAHPDKYGLTRTKLYTLLERFVAAGGEAMEVVNGEQLPAVTQKLNRACQDFSLLASCGSDFHSTVHAWQSPGKISALPSSCEPIWQAWQ